MTNYHYSPASREYLGHSPGEMSPLDNDYPLIPAYATDIEPPLPKPGFAIVWSDGQWSHIPDHRGKIVWSKQTRDRVEIFDLGEVPDDYTSIEPTSVDVWDAATERWMTDQAAVAKATRRRALSELAESDAGLVRGLEDLIEVLKAKQVLTDADLPAELCARLTRRKELRATAGQN